MELGVNKMRFIFLICLMIPPNILLAEKIKINPSIFAIHSTDGKDWMYEKKPINIFGLGINTYVEHKQWNLVFDYLQIGLLGNVNQNIFDFSPQQSFAYIDESKDADGYWTEYVNSKLNYNYNDITIELGKFDRHLGNGIRSLHISKKAPSFPQVGFKYQLNQKWNYLYFHGFLNSNIPDTTRSVYYENNFSKRSISIPRNIAYHRVEWRPNNKFSISFNESVIYATRSLDIHYIIPILPFYPIENYIGDTDNIQMGCDIVYNINKFQKLYLAFFMDEFTPEWIFKSKNHNWFGWQFGYSLENLILQNSELELEYNWTDQRIYMHKYSINDFYNHGYPLGFWAGPHAQEFLLNYYINFGDKTFKIHFSNSKRGLNTRNMVKDNYVDSQSPRFESGYEKRTVTSINFKKATDINNLLYIIDINYIKFVNAGFHSNGSHLSNGVNIEKISIEFGLFYNFSIKNYYN